MQINPQEILNKKILIPCEYTKCQMVGIDLTINETLILPNLQFANILLNEKVFLPNNVFAMFTHRSNFNRRGILIAGSIYEPNYSGQIGCSIYNMSGKEIKIEKNERIGQMVFYKANAASQYNGQWQNEHLSH